MRIINQGLFVFLLSMCSGHLLFSNAYKSNDFKYIIEEENSVDNCTSVNYSDHLALNPPPPPVNDVCIGALDFGVLGCQYVDQYLADPEATPDPEATGNCIQNTDPALWFTFTTPSPLPYSSIVFGVSNVNTEIFKTTSGCSDLVYVTCGIGIFTWDPEPGTKYYLLATNGQYMFTPFYTDTYCNDPYLYLSTISGNPITGPATTDCGTPSNIPPCLNDYTVWYEYTTGCQESDLLIELNDYSGSLYNTAEDVSISAVLDDCTTLMSAYDANGTGYVCSAIANNQSLLLENLPPHFTFLIAYGSEANNTGHFDFSLTETTNAPEVNDICPESVVLFEGFNLDLSNVCSTLTSLPNDIEIQGCAAQSEGTVWYEYDPMGELQDITINLLSSGIILPAMAAYDGCIGSALASFCGPKIELSCIDFPIMIEVGSALLDAGTFDLEIVTIPSLSSDLFHDTCDGAETLSAGLNQTLSNKCASLTGPPTDAAIPGCGGQSAATVWYQFDPGFGVHDITINLISTGITSPALAAYDGCLGNVLEVNCNATLELTCIEAPIYIEVGSSIAGSGSFDLDISTSPSMSSLVPEVLGNNICSGSEAGITINIPNGELVNIIIEISPASSSSILGMTTHVFNGINSANINDILINNSFIDQQAIYTITIVPLGASCPPEPVEFTVVVYPKFEVTEFTIDECLPYLLVINVDDIIDGGSLPYFSIAWYWNEFNLIGSSENLTTDLQESGLLSLELIDDKGCEQSAEIYINITIPILPSFDFPLEYCRSDQDYIIFPESSLEVIDGMWNIPLFDLSVTPDGFYDIVFTPDDVSCTLTTSVTIEIFTGEDLEFDLPSVICSDEDEIIFPTVDINGVSGTWNTPSVDPSSTSGIQFNIFTPNSQNCYAQFEYVFEVTDGIELTFGNPDSLCKNDAIFTLSDTSEEGFEGSWDFATIDPSLISGDSFTSTWTPLPGQSPCIQVETVTIQIIDIVSPEFDLPNEICSTDSIFVFPPNDMQSIAGSWSIDTIILSQTTEFVQSTFTPIDDCVASFWWEIEIINPLIPEFTFDTSFCSLDTVFNLPMVSDGGISGTWSVPTIDPSLFPGQMVTTAFQALDSNFCVENIEVIIEIEEAKDPLFDLPDKFCWEDSDFTLPTDDMNAIQGSWNPAIIEIGPNLGEILSSTFTPNDGNCSNILVDTFEIIAPYNIALTVTDPSDCTVDDGMILITTSNINLEYSIDGGSTWQSATVFDSLSSGGYSILVRSTEFVACLLSRDTILNSSNGPSLNEIISNDLSSCIDNNGSIIIDAEGSNLEYSIDGGLTWQSSNEFNDLLAGAYVIQIREFMSDCIVEATTSIDDFPQTEILDIHAEDISDCNLIDGQIEIIASGQSLEYSIDNGISWSSNNIFQNLPAGDYNIIVQSTEASDCAMFANVELLAPSIPVLLNVDVQSPSICSPESGRIEIEGEGNNLEFSIDGGNTWHTTNIFENIEAGPYQVIVRDSTRINCFEETSILLLDDDDSLVASTFQITLPTDCDTADGILEIDDPSIDFEYSLDGGINWQSDPIFNNLAAGLYQLITRKISLPDCLVEQSIEVPNPDCPCNALALEFLIDDLSCEDATSGAIDLVSVQGMDDSNINIIWQNGTTGQSIDGIGEGWQLVTIEYDDLCVWKDSVYVDRLSPIQFDITTKDLDCPDDNNGIIEILNVIGGSSNFSYSLDGINYQLQNQFTGLAPGNYEVFVRDDTDCETKDVTEIAAPSVVQISLPEIISITLGESTILDPGIDISQIQQFNWSSDNGFLNTTELILEVSPETTTTYVLEIYFGDCVDRREITIEVLADDDSIQIGNIFSPNGDNMNDYLYIQGKFNSEIQIDKFNVFDRWGNEIFSVVHPELNNEDDGWDGYSLGKKVVPGVYVYMINYLQNGESKIQYGTVTLIR